MLHKQIVYLKTFMPELVPYSARYLPTRCALSSVLSALGHLYQGHLCRVTAEYIQEVINPQGYNSFVSVKLLYFCFS